MRFCNLQNLIIDSCTDWVAAILEIWGRFPAPTNVGAGSDGIVSDNPFMLFKRSASLPEQMPQVIRICQSASYYSTTFDFNEEAKGWAA